MDKKSEYWQKVKIGNIIELTDAQTLDYLLEKKIEGATNGADFEVTRIKIIKQQEGLAEWRIFFIEFHGICWYLVAKITGKDVETKIYYQPDNMVWGNRQDLLSQNLFWLFNEPENKDNYVLKNLTFTELIEEEGDVQFVSDCTFYGEGIEIGIEGKKDFVTIKEYHSENTKTNNPDILLIEFNNSSVGDIATTQMTTPSIDFENSFIMFLQGCPINSNDMNVL